MDGDYGVIGKDRGRLEAAGGRVYLGLEDLATWTKIINGEVNCWVVPIGEGELDGDHRIKRAT